MIDLWRRLDVTVRDLAFGLLLAGLALIPALGGYGTQVGNLPTRPMDAFALLVVAVECLPLALRRRWPAGCLALVSAGFAVDQLWGYHTVSGSALPIALLSAAAYLPRYRWTTVASASAAYAALAVALASRGSSEGWTGFVTFYFALALAWGIGAWLRQSRAAEAEHRRHVAETTRTAERTRIARELHDVVTHHVTAMVVQTEAARYLTAAPERLDQALSAITDTGRLAITDLRHLLDLLNPGYGTEPRTSGSLETLIEQTRRAGQPVEFTEVGSPAAAGSAEAVAYRVVQEALTNALKHAHGSRTEVRVEHGAREIVVEVTSGTPKLSVPSGSVENGGAPAGPVVLPGSGRGLVGLRERVDVLGGEFTAERREGEFVVTARIPAGRA
ncbi:Signal transduction histidine kinase [Amycolatopsis pretoriensis]|uniref:histidine kinase n=1 Tax=Amycolatopsis pretoriensis TaxID=218821 RepID=A0A1H5QTR6_9PSEU|nr:histidine kinase [Amycolatopsis pretoriensis]SEF29513.1 Signal transduction histidine kinase [Amycolatopsis pretoriensis]